MHPDRFVFRRQMLVLVVLVIVETAYLAAAGFPSETHAVPLVGSWFWEIRLHVTPLGPILALWLYVAVWRELRPAYYVTLLLETLTTLTLAFTVARLALLLGGPVRLTLMRGLALRTAIARM